LFDLKGLLVLAVDAEDRLPQPRVGTAAV